MLDEHLRLIHVRVIDGGEGDEDLHDFVGRDGVGILFQFRQNSLGQAVARFVGDAGVGALMREDFENFDGRRARESGRDADGSSEERVVNSVVLKMQRIEGSQAQDDIGGVVFLDLEADAFGHFAEELFVEELALGEGAARERDVAALHRVEDRADLEARGEDAVDVAVEKAERREAAHQTSDGFSRDELVGVLDGDVGDFTDQCHDVDAGLE